MVWSLWLETSPWLLTSWKKAGMGSLLVGTGCQDLNGEGQHLFHVLPLSYHLAPWSPVL